MKNFDVYFEICGKKLMTTIFSESEEKAKQIVRNKIVFHKVVPKPNDDFNKIDETLTKIMDLLDGNKK